MTELNGKTALITGAAKRIGRQIALVLAQADVNTILHYRSSENSVQQLKNQIEKQGVKSWLLKADFSKQEEVENLVQKARELTPDIEFLINSASVFSNDTLMELTFDKLKENILVNAYAPYVISREFFRQCGSGHIINLLDTRITDYDRNHIAYHLSKRMLFSLTRMMSVEFAPSVLVNGVAPGLILPPEGKDESYLEMMKHTNPLDTRGSINEVTSAVMFLLKSRFITGQVIFIDGGQHLNSQFYGI
jgi:pteridine reductase